MPGMPILAVPVQEDPIPVSITHPAIDALARFFREGTRMINFLVDNPTADLEQAIDHIDRQDGGGIASLRVRIVPVWDAHEGWRFFFRYPDGSRIETGRPNVFGSDFPEEVFRD